MESQPNRSLSADSALLYSILSRVEPSRLLDTTEDRSLRSSAIAKTVVELYPITLFSSGLQLTPIGSTSQNAIKQWTEWEEKNDFLSLCTEAAIEARWIGDSFLVLDDGGDWSSPLRSPPESVFRISYAYASERPFLSIGDDLIHESKVIHFAGNKNTQPNYTLQDGWRNQFVNLPVISGVLEHCIRLLELAPDTLITALRTSSQFILGQEGLANMLYADQLAGTNTAEQKIALRATTLNRSRDNGSIILYDSDSESLNSITSSTANLDAIYHCLKDAVACHSGIPSKALFDMGTVGLGSGLQNQLVARFEIASKAKQWGDFHVRSKLKSLLNVFGTFSLEFPLKVSLNTGELVEYEKALADRNKVLIESGVVTAQEVRESYREPGEITPIHLTLTNPETVTSLASSPESDESDPLTLDSESRISRDSEDLAEIDPEFLEIDWESLIYVDVATAIEVSESAVES